MERIEAARRGTVVFASTSGDGAPLAAIPFAIPVSVWFVSCPLHPDSGAIAATPGVSA